MVLILWILLGVVGAVISSGKGKPWAGFFLGFLLGPIGWIIAALLSPTPQIAAYREDQRIIAQGGKTAAMLEEEEETEAELRREAMVEAIHRDPSLASGDDAGTLERLDEATQRVQREWLLRQERDQALGTWDSGQGAA